MALTTETLVWNTQENWIANSAVLSAGYEACESDTGQFKKGDGVHTYAQLSYQTSFSLINQPLVSSGSYKDIY